MPQLSDRICVLRIELRHGLVVALPMRLREMLSVPLKLALLECLETCTLLALRFTLHRIEPRVGLHRVDTAAHVLSRWLRFVGRLFRGLSSLRWCCGFLFVPAEQRVEFSGGGRCGAG